MKEGDRSWVPKIKIVVVLYTAEGLPHRYPKQREKGIL
jgi:hypothetical protein